MSRDDRGFSARYPDIAIPPDLIARYVNRSANNPLHRFYFERGYLITFAELSYPESLRLEHMAGNYFYGAFPDYDKWQQRVDAATSALAVCSDIESAVTREVVFAKSAELLNDNLLLLTAGTPLALVLAELRALINVETTALELVQALIPTLQSRIEEYRDYYLAKIAEAQAFRDYLNGLPEGDPWDGCPLEDERPAIFARLLSLCEKSGVAPFEKWPTGKLCVASESDEKYDRWALWMGLRIARSCLISSIDTMLITLLKAP